MRKDHDFQDAEDSEFPQMTYEPRILDSMHAARETSEPWGGGTWDTSAHVDGTNRGYESVTGESDVMADQETLEKVWSWTVDLCSQIWEKLEPAVVEYLPEDRNPFWVCGVLVLVFFLAIAGSTPTFYSEENCFQ